MAMEDTGQLRRAVIKCRWRGRARELVLTWTRKSDKGFDVAKFHQRPWDRGPRYGWPGNPGFGGRPVEISERQQEIGQEARGRNPQVFSWTGSIWHVHLPDRAAAYNAMADARIRKNDEYMNQRLNQIRKAKSILKLSPTSVFIQLAEQICQTGIDRYENFYRQVFDYRKQLHQFIVDADRQDEKVPHLVYERDNGATISKRKVETNAIPKFEEIEMNYGSSLKDALGNIAILLGFNIFLFLGVYWAFNRYDVR